MLGILECLPSEPRFCAFVLPGAYRRGEFGRESAIAAIFSMNFEGLKGNQITDFNVWLEF